MASRPPANRGANQGSAVSAAAFNAAQPFRLPYLTGGGVLGVMLVFMFVIWLNNFLGIHVGGTLGVSIILTIIGSVIIWFFGISPIMQVYATSVGGLFNILSLSSPARGISNGQHKLFKAVLVVFYIFLLWGIFHSTIYVWNNPGLPWALTLIFAALLVTGSFYNIRTGKEGYIISGFLLIFALVWLLNISIGAPASMDVMVVTTAGELGDLWPDSWLSPLTAFVLLAAGLGALFLIARALGGSAGAATGGLLGLLVPLAVLAAIGGGLYWWSTSSAKATAVCQAEDSPGWVMKLGELRTFTAGCDSYRINYRLLPRDAQGKALFIYDSPDIKPVDEVVTQTAYGNIIVFRVSQSELERRGLTTMRIGFCRGRPGDDCIFPEAAKATSVADVVAAGPAEDSGIDPEKAEAAIK